MHALLTPIRAVKLLTVLATGLATILAANLAPAAEAPVRWKFKEGETLNYVLERGVEGKLNLTGSEIVFKMGMAFDVAWKAKSVAPDGNAELELTIDRMQINMASPLGGNLAYDSTKPEAAGGVMWAQMEPMVTGMLNQTFRLKVTSLGKVSDIELPQKLTDVFLKQQQSPNRQAGFGIGGSAFSEKGIKELIEKSVLPLPEAAPAKDVSWTQHFDNPIRGAGNQMTDTTFTFAGTESVDGKQLAKIAAKTEMTFEPVENPMADVEITSQEGSGTFLFDTQAGHLIKATGVQTFFLEMTGARDLTQDMKETMSMRVGKSPAAEAKAAAK